MDSNWFDLCLFLARDDINDILDRLNKMENNNAMKDALTGGDMGDNQVDAILKAINDMQDKINADIDEKLKNYVPMPLFLEAEAESKSVSRRVAHNEQTLKQVKETTTENAERIDNNRKKINKL